MLRVFTEESSEWKTEHSNGVRYPERWIAHIVSILATHTSDIKRFDE